MTFRAWKWCVLSLLGVLTQSSLAFAWVETTVKADSVFVEIDATGAATVRHELLLRVRGGPLKSYTLEGVDPDAVPLPDATVILARSGVAAGAPLPLVTQLTDDGLELRVEHKEGLARGTFLFRFSYSTALLARELVKQAEDRVEVGWIGPRLPDGIDAAMVTFRVPRAPLPPSLPEAAEDGVQLDGVFLASLRRTNEMDEFEVVRPYVARGEPVYWRVHVDPTVFPVFRQTKSQTAPVEEFRVGGSQVKASPAEPWCLLLGATLLGLLVGLKHRAVELGCRARQVASRPLLRGAGWLRAVLAGVCCAAAGALVLWTDYPLLAIGPALASMALTLFLSPVPQRELRMPGQWIELNLRRTSSGQAPIPLLSRLLDAGTPAGFLVLLTLLAGVLLLAIQQFTSSPIRGVGVVMASVLLLPLFLTGRSAELPVERLRYAERFFKSFLPQARRLKAGHVVVIGRFQEGRTEPDEIRLKLVPDAAPACCIEVALEHFHGVGGPLVHPVVLVRVPDGSASYRAFPRGVVWLRGRNAHERVTVLRPKLPTRALVTRLLREVVEVLARGQASATSAARSKGNPTVTSNRDTTLPPLHAT